MQDDEPESVSAALKRHIDQAITSAGGWIGFDRFMALALYTPGLGYYASRSPKFGLMPQSGSDFVTAPELSPLFGRALARQVAQALRAVSSAGEDAEVWEFGAGSGALAEQLLDELDALGPAPSRYTIVDLSGVLRERQQARLARFGEQVRWADTLPEVMRGVVLGNEVLDAMPVQLLHWSGAPEMQAWHERGVALHQGSFVFADRESDLRPPLQYGAVPGTTTEVHPQAEAFIRTLASRLGCGAAFFIDYGFPEAEYYHPQRSGGTLMCHQAHRADANPLLAVGAKDITAHVNFTGIALAAQAAGAEVLGYTSQARFLFNCGLAELLQDADLRQRAMAQKLVNEHEMGELFKVIGFARGLAGNRAFDPIGFAAGDRSHRL